MSKELLGAHIFSAGVWNDLTFTEADLDGIVQAFNQLSLSGRVPLKFGHNDEQPVTDGQPALGWVQRVWRDGKKLLADFSGIPTTVFEAIRKELYKFVSIELLRDAERDGVKYSSVLDAVALLGADPPAVTNLDALSKLAWSRGETGLQFKARYAFTQGSLPITNFSGVKQPMADEKSIEAALAPHLAELKELREKFSATDAANKAKDAELATAKAALKAVEDAAKAKTLADNKAKFTAMIETAVKSGRITPATRDKIKAKFGATDEALAIVDFDVVEMALGDPKANTGAKPGKSTAFSRNEEGEPMEGAADEAKAKVEELVTAKAAADPHFARLDSFAQRAQILRLHPSLGKTVHAEILAGDR